MAEDVLQHCHVYPVHIWHPIKTFFTWQNVNNYHCGRLLLTLLVWTSFCPKYCLSRSVCLYDKEFDIADCREKMLRSVPQDLPLTVEKLMLGDNNIESIGKTDFARYSNLQWLFMQENKLTTIDSIAFIKNTNLRDLHFDKNRLTSINFFLPRNLVTLSLRENYIKELPTNFLSDLSHLSHLDLSSNHLTIIHPDIFQRMTIHSSVLSIDFANNQLKTLDYQVVHPLINNQPNYGKLEINLSGNEIHCNCLLKWVVGLEHDSLSVASFDLRGECASPGKLIGRAIMKLPHNEFICTPPHILVEDSQLFFTEGDTAHIECPAVGDPPPIITWYSGSSGDKRVAQGEVKGHWSVDEFGTLHISSVAISDGPFLQCSAVNGFGQSVQKFSIEIAPNPSTQRAVIAASITIPLILIIIIVIVILICYFRRRLCYLWNSFLYPKSRGFNDYEEDSAQEHDLQYYHDDLYHASILDDPPPPPGTGPFHNGHVVKAANGNINSAFREGIRDSQRRKQRLKASSGSNLYSGRGMGVQPHMLEVSRSAQDLKQLKYHEELANDYVHQTPTQPQAATMPHKHHRRRASGRSGGDVPPKNSTMPRQHHEGEMSDSVSRDGPLTAPLGTHPFINRSGTRDSVPAILTALPLYIDPPDFKQCRDSIKGLNYGHEDISTEC